MAKNIVQDVVPSKKSIRDISVPSRRAQTTDSIQKPKEKKKSMGDIKIVSEDSSTPASSTTVLSEKKNSSYTFDYDIDRPRGEKKWGLYLLLGVFGLSVVFGIMSIFASAKVQVIPKSQTVPIQVTLTASKDQPAGQFGYQIVSVSSSLDKQVDAGAQKQTDIKASGSVVIYNNSVGVQNLIANTRLQTASGLIFRLTKAVSVPKATVKNKQTFPGSIIAQITADKSGDKYNVGLTDFTLPGLVGSPQYKNVYARSKTPIAGGFSGMMKSVDQAVLTSATNLLQDTLKATVKSQILSQLPSNFVLYPQSISYNFGTVTEKDDSVSGKATLTDTVTASAIIFDEALLSQAILSSASSTLSSQGQAGIKNLNALTFSLIQPPVMTKDYSGNINFSITGDAQVVWLFDASALKNDLLGLKKSNLNPLLQAKYPAISQVKASISPFWKQSFPSDPEKITITQIQ